MKTYIGFLLILAGICLIILNNFLGLSGDSALFYFVALVAEIGLLVGGIIMVLQTKQESEEDE